MARWYQSRWWYVERPVPWLPVVFVCAVVLGAIAFGVWL